MLALIVAAMLNLVLSEVPSCALPNWSCHAMPGFIEGAMLRLAL